MTANDTSTIETTEAVNPDGELRQGLFAAQAARIVELQAEIASRQEEVDELKARILDSHPAGTYQAGNLKVQVKPGARRINAGTFEKAYPATKYPGAYQLRPRPQLVGSGILGGRVGFFERAGVDAARARLDLHFQVAGLVGAGRMRVEDTGLQLVDLLLTGRDLGLQFDDARRLRGEQSLAQFPVRVHGLRGFNG